MKIIAKLTLTVVSLLIVFCNSIAWCQVEYVGALKNIIDTSEEWDQKHRFIYMPGVFEGTLMRFSPEKKTEICIEDLG
jgi:hypothetical protein